MNSLKNSQGYSLLLSLSLIILFSALALSLITLTTSGISKNEIRQDNTRAIDQADKGIDYIIADIQKKLDTIIKSEPSGIPQSDFKRDLISTIESYYCVNNKSKLKINSNTGLGHVEVCIEDDPNLNLDGNNPLKKIVTIQSTGFSGNKNISKVVRSQVELGADAVPEQLKFAVSTNNDGNLYLHGGVDITGDLKVDGNVIITQKAKWSDDTSPKWVNSTYSNFISLPNQIGPSKLYIRNDKNIYQTNNCIYKTDCGGGNDYYKSINNKFSDSSTTNKYFTQFSKTLNKVENKEPYNLLFHTNKPSIVEGKKLDDNIDILNKITEIKTKSTKGSSKYRKISSLNDIEKDNVFDASKFDSVFIEGNVNISSCSICSRQTKELKGNFYIQGNLTINDINLITENTIIYVSGEVDIKLSTISGKKINGTKTNGKLIIFSNGNIDISNISEFAPESSTIQGFFFTKQDLVMYGVGSNIKIIGGISAKRTILTALRGNPSPEYRGLIFKYLHDIIPDPYASSKASRLQIIYDPGITEAYEQLNRSVEEKVQILSDPVVKSKNY
ncbi:hypothetical protein [Psychrobacillus sp. FSL H8-0487]|uniref:hypothetical protein n=1 Tax=Psychrobacillus sp. FSL H8-0487 TaxID=2921391 RepID=UPI0030F7C389